MASIDFPITTKLDENSYHEIKTPEQLRDLVLDLYAAFDALEEIAAFDDGSAGDLAMQTLKRAGVWSGNVTSLSKPKPIFPRRDDDVALWLKRVRERFSEPRTQRKQAAWTAIDYALDEYRLHADTGTRLHEDIDETGGGIYE